MSKLSRIVRLCTVLDIPIQDVELYAGYKQVYFCLPESIIDALRDENGDYDTEAYEKFCDTHGIWYDSEMECWA
jgi:hypothetical protein